MLPAASCHLQDIRVAASRAGTFIVLEAPSCHLADMKLAAKATFSVVENVDSVARAIYMYGATYGNLFQNAK